MKLSQRWKKVNKLRAEEVLLEERKKPLEAAGIVDIN